MADELRPCPFCGGESVIRYSQYGPCWYGWCNECETRSKCYMTEAEAVMAWNTRTERTCEMKQEGMFLVCSECGVVLMGNPRYCSRCGARVLSEEEQGHMVADAIRRLEKAVKE